MCEFFALRYEKTTRDREPMFCIKAPISKFIKTYLHSSQYPLKTFCFWIIKPPLFFLCAKYSQRHKKYKEYENSTIKLVSSYQTFAEYYFIILIFLKFEPKELISYIQPFNGCLAMKNWNPQKWLTLVYTACMEFFVDLQCSSQLSIDIIQYIKDWKKHYYNKQ